MLALSAIFVAVLLMGAAEKDKKKGPQDVVAKSFTLVDGTGRPRASLYSTGDKTALRLARSDGEVGAWLQVSDSDAVLNMPRPGEERKTGVILYSNAEHEGVGVLAPNGNLRWHSPE